MLTHAGKPQPIHLSLLNSIYPSMLGEQNYTARMAIRSYNFALEKSWKGASQRKLIQKTLLMYLYLLVP